MLMIIACLTMLVDHIAFCFLDNMPVLRMIGRIAMPIYAYFISEGFRYSHDKNQYIKRIGLIAVASQLPYMWMTREVSLNVCVVWFLSLLILVSVETFRENKFRSIMLIICSLYALVLFPMDYGVYAALWVAFFSLRAKINGLLGIGIMSVGVVLLNFVNNDPLQWASLAAIPIILICEKKNKVRTENKQIKQVYRTFYPLHMLVLCMLRSI